ncbi:targeting protein for Xklp2 isoform X1 [Hypomesus transpacificus]|uniref:targeting protein for Xklp2 isoform X1 n=1 Tax=Hypomesus transpacificus TaxID=137520 RepID=UPI001F082BA4|nr:targeting protein for Xklp2 isoform X1 [Hypomesus transpacificus]
MAQSESANLYEYDAPSDVVDFEAPDHEDKVDHWFEQQGSGEDGFRLNLATPPRHNIPFCGNDKASLPLAVISPRVKEDACYDAQSTSVATVSNIVTSWGPTRPVQKTVQPKKKGPVVQPRRVSKRNQAAINEPTVPVSPAAKKRRNVNTVTSFQPQRRSSSSIATRRRSAARASVRLESRTKTKAQAATATQSQQKSSEQQEMERIKSLQKEVAEQRKRNEASYRAAMAGSQPPRKMVLSTTVPKEFSFSTDGRVKPSSSSTDNSQKQIDFNAQLRKHPSSPAKGPRGTTVPKPFNLSTGSKRKGEDPAPYVSVAEQIEQFQKRTPARYHLRSRMSQERGPALVKSEHRRITQPHTPQLMTRTRSRPTFTKSSAELEEEELQKLQQFKFKALELNRKILEGALNPKKPAVKEPTKPEGFHLQMDKRLQEKHASKKPEEPEEHYSFHSRPLPTRILEEVVGVPEKKVIHPTIPESPAFALKNRVRIEKKVEEVNVPAPIKAHAAPHFGLPFLPKLQEKSQVDVCPFSFDERERERRVMKEKRLEELRHEEVPKFKAQPLPDFHEVVLPEKKVVEPTKPEPFKLLIDERGAVKSDRWEQALKEEQKHQMEAASFKARPNTVTHKEPFLPKKENRTVLEDINRSVVPEGVQLSTERRAKERQEFDRIICEKEALRARVEEQHRMEQEERQKAEIAAMRQDQVHKAQPIRHYKPVELKKSDVSLTVPQSPNFSDRFRM